VFVPTGNRESPLDGIVGATILQNKERGMISEIFRSPGAQKREATSKCVRLFNCRKLNVQQFLSSTFFRCLKRILR